jgi:hypothetical protein
MFALNRVSKKRPVEIYPQGVYWFPNKIGIIAAVLTKSLNYLVEPYHAFGTNNFCPFLL